MAAGPDDAGQLGIGVFPVCTVQTGNTAELDHHRVAGAEVEQLGLGLFPVCTVQTRNSMELDHHRIVR